MQILCNDIGRGTQDILLYDSELTPENCPSMILPSPVAVKQRQLEQALMLGKTPLFYGTNMGGFPLGKYIGQLKQRGQHLLATPAAAKSFNDNLDELQAMGLKLVAEENVPQLLAVDDIAPIQTLDFDWEGIIKGLEYFGVRVKLDGVAIAVQDHGEAPAGMSDRQFRFQHYRRLLEANIPLANWIYSSDEIPGYLTRMKAAAQSLPPEVKFKVMDTGPAAILGCLEDEGVAKEPSQVIINIGNGHTLAAYLQEGQIIGLWEHHTQRLNSDKIQRLVDKLIHGDLQDKEVFDDGGHGAYLKQKNWPLFGPDIICVTGPNRNLVKDSGYYMVNPHGQMMLTGAYGLLRAFLAERQAGTLSG